MIDDYIFTTNGFRKIASPVLPPHKRKPMLSRRQQKEITNKKKIHETVYKSDTMDKYKIQANNEIKYRSRSAKPSSAPPRRVNSATQTDIIYSVRNPDCKPPQMYLHENVRFYAKQQDQQTTHRRRALSADVAYRFGKPIRLPKFVDNEHLTNEGLTMGQKQYIWGIARCYSMENTKKLNHRRTQSVLDYEFLKRSITKDLSENVKTKLWKEYSEYKKFICSKNGIARNVSSSPCSHLVGGHHRLHKSDSEDSDAKETQRNTTNTKSYDCVVLNNNRELKKTNMADDNFKMKQPTPTNKYDDKENKGIQRPKSAHHLIKYDENVIDLSEDSSYEDDLVILTDEHLTIATGDSQSDDQFNRL